MFNISADFPGGNIIVENIDGDAVQVHQDWSTSSEWWFYWAFRVSGAGGRTLHFSFTDRDVFTGLGPCWSVDGRQWQWLGSRDGAQTFSFAFAPDQDEVYFALAPLYTETHLGTFLQRNPEIQSSTLWRTEHGRGGELLRLPSAEGRSTACLLARSHACETTANFVLEGMLEFWLRDTGQGEFLRQWVDFVAIPFCDKDGVEQGDQGKLRAPHDHNRDWLPEPRYAATRALQAAAGTWRGQLAYHLDLHCPWIRSGNNEQLFFVGMAEPQASRWRQYCVLLQATQRGPLCYNAEFTLPHGSGWNVGDPPTSANWFAATFPTIAACSIEIPYAIAGGQEVNAENLRAFGGDMARALAISLGAPPSL